MVRHEPTNRFDEWIDARGFEKVLTPAALEWRDPWVVYPVSSKSPVFRMKHIDSNATPKYKWDPPDAEKRPTYYALPGFAEAVKAAAGEIIGAAGEPDLWTFYAAGHKNALCWFGEGAVPRSIIGDLLDLGGTRFVYYLDHDVAGLKAAAKLAELFAGKLIELELRWNPKWMHTKYDINRLWIDSLFLPTAFNETLAAYDILTAADLPMLVKQFNTVLPKNINQQAEVEARTRAEIEKGLVKRGAKPGVYDCPLPHGPDGKDFLYVSGGPIGGCQGKHQGMLNRWVDLARYLEIDVTAIAREIGAETVAAPKNGRQPNLEEASRPPDFKTAQSDEVYADLLALHEGKRITDSEIFWNPYEPFRQLKGLNVVEGRKATLVIGTEGGGKTSHLGRWLIGLRAMGFDAFVWSAENSPIEQAMYDVERVGGPDYETQRRAQMAYLELKRGVKKHIIGRPFTPDELSLAAEKTAWLMSLPGRLIHFDEPGATVEEMCKKIEQMTPDLISQGRRPRVVVIDYAQLVKSRGGGWDELEFVAGSYNTTCHKLNLHFLLAAQTTKDLSDRVKRGHVMGVNAAQGLSPQRFQAVYTLNPIYDADGCRMEKAVINVCKANGGPAPIRLTVRTAFFRHDWTSEVTDNRQVGEIHQEPELDLGWANKAYD